jgi:elongation factor P--(R)-beta-lysine ligase
VTAPHRREPARARARLAAETRRVLGNLGYEEVETPTLVPAPGMEPHLAPFEAAFHPEHGGGVRPLWLITSPEYAMKRLLADGFERIFQLSRVFRDGELSATHNPEFTMLEFYRAGTDYRGIMADLERLIEAAARALDPGGSSLVERQGRRLDLAAPFERLTVQEAFARHAGVDLAACRGQGDRLRAAARAAGHEAGPDGEPFEDAFFRLMLGAVEPRLGATRPTFLLDWPASMAALSRVKAGDPRWAERFELYAGGLELANGFTELNDPVEQRARLLDEQAQRRRLGRPALPLDEPFLAALARMPDAGGVAVGFDRLLMLLTGAPSIAEVLLFPAAGFLGP